MRTALLFLLGLVVQDASHSPPSPGPRRAIAGIPGFQAISLLDFGDNTARPSETEPDRPPGDGNASSHPARSEQMRLTAVYIFPDRVRWYYDAADPKQPKRLHLYYRQGALVNQLSGGARSTPVTGAERETVLMEMELRRAAMLWPDGFDWEETRDGVRSAKVYEDSCCRRGELGTLVASPLRDGRPEKIEARFADGEACETVEIRAWQRILDRDWPMTMAVHSEKQSFTEHVESVDTRVHFLDQSFLPADRRPLPSTGEAGPQVIARDIVPMTYAVHELVARIDWKSAQEQAQGWIAEAAALLKPRGFEVDPVATFELDSAGMPVRCLVRLSAAVTQPPAGFRTLPERAGVFLVVPDTAALNAEALKRLGRAAPAEAHPGIPYARLHQTPKPQVEVVLPLEPD